MTAAIRVLSAFQRRALNEIVRVPGGAIPGVLAPAIFLIGLSGVFGAAGDLKGYQGDFTAYILPFGMLQGATFTGAATGVNLARDIEQGWFDRLLLAPQRRSLLLLGLVSSASLRATLPATFLLLVGFALGVGWPGIGALIYTAISARDLRVVQGATVVIAVTFVLLNVLVDLLQMIVDPRQRRAA